MQRFFALTVAATLTVLVVLIVHVSKSRSIVLHRIPVSSGGEKLIMEGKLLGRRTFFQLDTGYAGPPVISLFLLGAGEMVAQKCMHWTGIEERFKHALDVAQSIPASERVRTSAAAIANSSCESYTSGCTMRLVSIGDVSEQQADMLLCGPLEFNDAYRRLLSPRAQTARPQADVVVTNALHGAPHIVTADYIFQVSPCCLWMNRGVWETCMNTLRLGSIAQSFCTFALRLVGGAPVMDVHVLGVRLVCTIDTGASGPVCLGKTAATRVLTRNGVHMTKSGPQQRGINNEIVSSSLTELEVMVKGDNGDSISMERVAVLANDRETAHTDGYVGMGFLRAFDILFTNAVVGLRRSGLAPLSSDEYA